MTAAAKLLHLDIVVTAEGVVAFLFYTSLQEASQEACQKPRDDSGSAADGRNPRANPMNELGNGTPQLSCFWESIGIRDLQKHCEHCEGIV